MTVLVPERPNRRDFLSWASYSLLGIGAVAAMWPFVDSMNPTGETIEETKVYLDLSGLAPEKVFETMWWGRPIFILRRTAAQLSQLEQSHPATAPYVPDEGFKPRSSPAYTRNWHRSVDPAIFVVVPLCSHCNCPLSVGRTTATSSWLKIPGYWSNLIAREPDNTRFRCLCCGSAFDLAGRRIFGPPSAADLYIPPYRFFPDRNHLIVGEDPPAPVG